MTARTWAILLAAGGGLRFGGVKQHADLDGGTVLERALATARRCCDAVVLVTADGTPGTSAAAPGSDHAPVRTVRGGPVRAESVRAGLAVVPAEADVIVVADAAHPLASERVYRDVVAAVRSGADGAVPGLPLTEVVAAVVRPQGSPPVVGAMLPAAGHVLVQTPQAFRAAALRHAHVSGAAGVEDSSMVVAAGGRVVIVPGDPVNVHVTTPRELDVARSLATPGGAAAVVPTENGAQDPPRRP